MLLLAACCSLVAAAAVALLIVHVVRRWVDRGGGHVALDRLTARINGEGMKLRTGWSTSFGASQPLAVAFPGLASVAAVDVGRRGASTPVRRLDGLEEQLRLGRRLGKSGGGAAQAAGAQTASSGRGGGRVATESEGRGAPPPCPALFLKDDGETSSVFGGNKARKLELLLADALAGGASDMLVMGAAGSHSVLATAVHARAHGLPCHVHLWGQEPAPRVVRTLVAICQCAEAAGSRVRYHEGARSLLGAVLGDFVRRFFTPGRRLPYVCPTGATTASSTIAYVNAMFELAADVRSGRLPHAPDRLYVPAGSAGTWVGLLVGARALPQVFGSMRLIAVRSGSWRPIEQAAALLRDVVRLLREATDGAFPNIRVTAAELETFVDYETAAAGGGGYGATTPAATEAIEAFAMGGGGAQCTRVLLETTYTAKAAARMIRDCRAVMRTRDDDSGNLVDTGVREQVWVLWHTNAALGAGADYPHAPPLSPADRQLLLRHLPAHIVDRYWAARQE